jgi:phosphatidylglycerophosphate synthase
MVADMNPENRRPLASRNTAWARDIARRLADRGLTPNQISVGSVGFAGLAFGLGWLSVPAPWLLGGLCLLLAAACCQARLLCNLFDGMVAVEGGRGAPDGPFWNEAPDRLADLLFFAGAGLAAGRPVLGLLCAAAALLTAYVRELGRAEGFPPDFGGPMAKQHRMAVLTAGFLLAAVWENALTLALWLVLTGAALTVVLRSGRLIRNLRSRAAPGPG